VLDQGKAPGSPLAVEHESNSQATKPDQATTVGWQQ